MSKHGASTSDDDNIGWDWTGVFASRDATPSPSGWLGRYISFRVEPS